MARPCFFVLKQKFHIIFLLLMTAIVVSCGSDDSFRITGEVDGLGTRNLRFYYYDGRELKVGMASAIDGKFNFIGNSKKPAILTISTAQRNILGRIVVENGDAIELKLNASDPFAMEVSGNKTSSEYASFLSDNKSVLASQNPVKINELIEKTVNDKNSRMSTTMAFLLHYEFRDNPRHADSILNLIKPDARPNQFVAGYRSLLERMGNETLSDKIGPLTMYCSDDSMTTFNPAKSKKSLLVFTRGTRARLDSINAAVDSVAPKKNDNNLSVVNISLDTDTNTWKKSLSEAPARGLNLWMPGAVSSSQIRKLNIDRVPAFIVVDSSGTRLYQGESMKKAIDTLK